MTTAPHPQLAGTGRALPERRLPQSELLDVLRRLWTARDVEYDDGWLAHFFESVGVEHRHLALPAEAYLDLGGFGDTNDQFIEAGTELGAEALERALQDADVPVSELDALFFTTVTGVASPSLDAKIANELQLPRDLKRVPMFGLGCVGGAAGLSRMSDYLRAYPDDTAALVAVETCSLTVERDDPAIADHVAAAIFGDGAMAAVGVGDAHDGAESRVLDSHRVLYPETEWVMGWEIDGTGFNLVLSGDLPEVVEEELPEVTAAFLDHHGLAIEDIRDWIVHPGGPAVMEAIESALMLEDDELEASWASLREVGNLSSASVLHVMQNVFDAREPDREDGYDLLMAMGPGFSVEFVLLEDA